MDLREDTVQAFIVRSIHLERELSGRMEELAKSVTESSAKGIFNKIHKDSEKHAVLLDRILRLLNEEVEKTFFFEGFSGELPDLDIILSHKTIIEITYYAAKEHIQVEREMINRYKKLYNKILSKEARNLLRKIIDDEKVHEEMLNYIVSTFREMFGDIIKD